MDDAYVSHHEMQFFEGVLIKEMFSDQETFAERLNLDADEDEQWDHFAGSERSKIFGIFTHCQKQKEEIEAITHSKNRSSCSKSVKMVLMMKACSVY